jgi:hypothetical protein
MVLGRATGIRKWKCAGAALYFRPRCLIFNRNCNDDPIDKVKSLRYFRTCDDPHLYNIDSYQIDSIVLRTGSDGHRHNFINPKIIYIDGVPLV